MAAKIGTGEVSFRLGSATPAAVYLGSEQVWSAANPFATLVSTKSTGNIFGTAKSDTGYIKVEWWDSTEDVYGTGVVGSTTNWSKAAGGAGEKTLRIYPSDASGNLSGALTTLICQNNSLTSLDVSGLTALTYLDCNSNSLTALDVSGLTALTYLDCNSNSLTALDVSGLTALTSLVCYANSLNSIRAVEVPGGAFYGTSASAYTSPYGSYLGITVFDNNLDANALNQLYADLADNSGGGYSLLFVGNNPGTAGDDPTIATAKNWIVLGS